MASEGRTVVIAVDASENAKLAFRWYLENICQESDNIIIAHVSEPPHLKSFSFKHGMNIPVEEWQKQISEQLENVRKLEDDYAAELVTRKLKYKTRSEQDKAPGQGIIRVAQSENASMIVMGTRGLDPFRRTLLGSVSDYVVRHSSIPVIICPKQS